MTVIYSENHMRYTYVAKMQIYFGVNANGIYSYHCALKDPFGLWKHNCVGQDRKKDEEERKGDEDVVKL
jgi:hypothetical protein